MNIITIDKDVNKIKTLLSTENKKAIKSMLISFTPEYRLRIYLQLNPFDQKKWNDLVN